MLLWTLTVFSGLIRSIASWTASSSFDYVGLVNPIETDLMIARIIKIVGLAVVFIIIAGASAYFTLTLVIKSEEAVIVPELVGKDVVYALETLTDLELNTKVKGSEYNNDLPKHHVIYQDPEPGTEIKKGRDVRIIISKGSKSIIMPNAPRR